MSTCCYHKTLKWSFGLPAIMLVVVIVFCVGSLRAETGKAPSGRKVVFLDPGHGGQDTGARSANGLLEKDVALALAKRIEQKMERDFMVRFSRNDDYNMELYHRTETANTLKADLFVSLHTGGAFNYSAEGVTIYYFFDSPGRVLPENATEELSFGQNTGRVSWDSVQYGHIAESRLLSQFLQTAIAGSAGSRECRIIGAPLLVLSSTDMPAVLIEVGCLNNPAEEEKLADPDYLDSLAAAISGGLKNYLGRTSDITSIDLHE